MIRDVKNTVIRRCKRAVMRIGFLLLICFPAAPTVRAAATFRPLSLFGGTRTRADDVSADGSVVVGFVDDVPNNLQSVFRWTSAESMLRPARPDAAVSGDGSVVVGSFQTMGLGTQAFRWIANGSFEGLNDFPGGNFHSAAFDASFNGSVIVGFGTTALGDEAFRWTQETGLVGLGDLPGGANESVALGVSADGVVVVGYSVDLGTRRQAFRWTAQTGMVGLGRMPGAEWSLARSVSADGSVVVGFNSFPPGGIGSPRARAFRWTASDGMVSLSTLPDEINQSEAHGVSADGTVIVGTGTTLSQLGELQLGAIYWTAATGMVNLQELLVSAGVTNLDGWSLSEARGVSADGLTVVGTGIHNGRTEAWVATVPEPSTIVLAALLATALFSLYVRTLLGNRCRSTAR